MKKSRTKFLRLVIFIPVLTILTFTFSVSNLANDISLTGIQDLQKSLKEWKRIWNYSNLNEVGNVATISVSDERGEYEKTMPTGTDNILFMLVNRDNKIFINGEWIERSDMLDLIENFISGNLPDGEKVMWQETKDLPHYGKVKVPMGIISFRCDLDASYYAVQEISEIIGTAYLNVRDQKSKAKFDQSYLSLNSEQKKIIEELVPIRITTGEPKVDREKNEVAFYQ